MPDPAAAIAATTDDGPDRGQPEAPIEEGSSSSMSSYAAGEKRLTLLNGTNQSKVLSSNTLFIIGLLSRGFHFFFCILSRYRPHRLSPST
jgi:hypothetical protein